MTEREQEKKSTNLDCKKRYGVEINPSAAATAKKNGVEVFDTVAAVPNDSIDVIISNNALEHALQPLDELRGLRQKLKVGGKIIFVVPCESISMKYKPNDFNKCGIYRYTIYFYWVSNIFI